MAEATARMNDQEPKPWSALKDAKVFVAKVEIGGGPKGEGPHQTLRDEQASEAERTYTTFQHLIGCISALDGMGFLGLIGAIIMWRIKANDSPYYDDHGREAVNFQISLLVYLIGGAIVLGLFTAITLGVGIVLAAPIAAIGAIFLIVLRLVGCIRGAIAANRGEYYRYPMCLRFLV